MRQYSSSNPESLGSTRYSQEWIWGERSTNSGSYFVQLATGNRECNDEEWWPHEVDLNTVTIGNMSIDSKPVETDGKRGRYREITVDPGAGESVVNPDDWPNVDLNPSKGSVEGQRYVDPGGVLDRQSGRTDSKSPYRTTRWRRHLKPSGIPSGQGP